MKRLSLVTLMLLCAVSTLQSPLEELVNSGALAEENLQIAALNRHARETDRHTTTKKSVQVPGNADRKRVITPHSEPHASTKKHTADKSKAPKNTSNRPTKPGKKHRVPQPGKTAKPATTKSKPTHHNTTPKSTSG